MQESDYISNAYTVMWDSNLSIFKITGYWELGLRRPLII